MKWFGIDFGIKYIIFETNDKQHIISFKTDLLGNIKNVDYAEGDKFSICVGAKDIKIISTRPNIFGRIRYLVDLIKVKIKVKMRKIFLMELRKS